MCRRWRSMKPSSSSARGGAGPYRDQGAKRMYFRPEPTSRVRLVSRRPQDDLRQLADPAGSFALR